MTKSGILRACVAGWPVAHSRSPLIHGYWLTTLGIDGVYERVAVPPGEFPAFAKTIGVDGLIGANVTVPHKEAAFAACDWRTPSADKLGAVNTLWREAGKLCGDNTDVAGFLANLDEAAPGWQARVAVVIGAGGAARAILQALLSRGVARTLVVNRTRARAQMLAALFGERVEARDWRDLPEALSGADLLVNASALGMAGEPPLAIDLAPLPTHALVADIVYVPLRTPLLQDAQARGLRCVEGLGMLLHQAAPAFARWFGVLPPVTPELRRLVETDIAQTSGHPR